VFGSAAPNSAAFIETGVARLQHVAGEPGTLDQVGVLLPDATPLKLMSINGNKVRFTQTGAYAWSRVSFQGQRFSHSEQIDLELKNGSLTGTFEVPNRIFKQLKARREQWPISWSKKDYAATWLVPERLLLYLQIAQATVSLAPEITIDGRSLTFEKAYASVRAHPASFVGFYLDISQIEADLRHSIVLKVPGLKPGQLQGLFVDNVEAEYTEALGH
jgi:hypothetical protein